LKGRTVIRRAGAALALAVINSRLPGARRLDDVDSNGAPIPSIATSLPGNGDPGSMRNGSTSAVSPTASC